MTPLVVVSALVGLVAGSFLNVVIHRVPRGESVIRPASHCPQCQATIRPWHNVPVVGWLLLRGRCADCGQPIAVRYLLVELGTGALFVAVTVRFGARPDLPAFLYLAAVAVALAVIDMQVRRLPDAIVLPSYLVGAALLAPAAALGHWRDGGRGLLAMAVLFAGYFAIAFVYPGGMGFGDVKLAGLLGLYLGWLGWEQVLVGAFAGFVIGGLVGVGLIVARRANGKTAVAFGPAMLAGAMLSVFVAGPVSQWYATFLRPGG